MTASVTRHPITQGTTSKASGVSRVHTYGPTDRKLAFFSGMPTAAQARHYKVYTNIEEFKAALFTEFKRSPLWDWWSRSSTWGGYGQASISVFAERDDRGTDYNIWGDMVPRAGNPARKFFADAVEAICQKINVRYSVYIVQTLGVSIYHHRKGP